MCEDTAFQKGFDLALHISWQRRATGVGLALGKPSVPFAGYHLIEERLFGLVALINEVFWVAFGSAHSSGCALSGRRLEVAWHVCAGTNDVRGNASGFAVREGV